MSTPSLRVDDRYSPCGLSVLSLLIFYSTLTVNNVCQRSIAHEYAALRYKHLRSVQALLFALSLLVSTRMIWLINRANYIKNMKQVRRVTVYPTRPLLTLVVQDPPLATLWIFAIVQLDLGPSVASLLVTGAFVWWKGLKTIF